LRYLILLNNNKIYDLRWWKLLIHSRGTSTSNVLYPLFTFSICLPQFSETSTLLILWPWINNWLELYRIASLNNLSQNHIKYRVTQFATTMYTYYIQKNWILCGHIFMRLTISLVSFDWTSYIIIKIYFYQIYNINCLILI
jgi:hypothetical protein